MRKKIHYPIIHNGTKAEDADVDVVLGRRNNGQHVDGVSRIAYWIFFTQTFVSPNLQEGELLQARRPAETEGFVQRRFMTAATPTARLLVTIAVGKDAVSADRTAILTMDITPEKKKASVCNNVTNQSINRARKHTEQGRKLT